jgi:hypothetical protein
MEKEVKKGEKIPVSIKLEFEGTVRSHSILVEKQFVPTTNNQAKNFPVELNGDPLEVSADFLGVKGSKIKTFEITINDKTNVVCKDVIFKHDGIEVKLPLPYSKFDLKETKDAAILNSFHLALEKTLEQNRDITLVDALALVVKNTK